jgi:hypothetical protein
LNYLPSQNIFKHSISEDKNDADGVSRHDFRLSFFNWLQRSFQRLYKCSVFFRRLKITLLAPQLVIAELAIISSRFDQDELKSSGEVFFARFSGCPRTLLDIYCPMKSSLVFFL